jgi:hypothetical protein
MDTRIWLPLISVVIGGMLTIISSLTVEVFRDRIRERRDVRSRRRSKLEELERTVLDAHTKMTTSSQLIAVIGDKAPKSQVTGPADLMAIEERSNQSNDLLLKLTAGSAGKIEILHAVGLAARVGTSDIRKRVEEYAAAQLHWSQSPTSSGILIDTMDQDIKRILELIALELAQLDRAETPDASVI